MDKNDVLFKIKVTIRIKIMKFKSIMVIAVITFCGLSSISNAANYKVTGNVVKVLTQDNEGDFGNCMVRLDVNISSSGASCPSQWISFSCTGDFNSKDIAYRLLDQATMSLVLGNEITVEVNDANRHNDYCVGHRVDLEAK